MPTNLLSGNTINVSQSTPNYASKINRTPIAATGRHQIHNLGAKNIPFNLNCWVKTQAEFDAIITLRGTSPLAWYDKFGDLYSVSIIKITPKLKAHDYITYNMILEEVA